MNNWNNFSQLAHETLFSDMKFIMRFGYDSVWIAHFMSYAAYDMQNLIYGSWYTVYFRLLY